MLIARDIDQINDALNNSSTVEAALIFSLHMLHESNLVFDAVFKLETAVRCELKTQMVITGCYELLIVLHATHCVHLCFHTKGNRITLNQSINRRNETKVISKQRL